MNKEAALSLLNNAGIGIDNVETLNLALLALADLLNSEEKEVPDEISNPQNYEEISREHLALIRDRAREVLASKKLIEPGKEVPELPAENSSNEPASHQESAITNSASRAVDRWGEEIADSRENAIQSFYQILSDLNVKYVGKAVGRGLSDEFWHAVDKARAEQDEKHLEQRIGQLKGDFDEAVEAIKDTKKKRKDWEEKKLGKLKNLSDFSEMDKTLKELEKDEKELQEVV